MADVGLLERVLVRLGGRAAVTSALTAASVGAACAVLVAALLRRPKTHDPSGAVICAIGTAVPPNAGDNAQFREVVRAVPLEREDGLR